MKKAFVFVLLIAALLSAGCQKKRPEDDLVLYDFFLPDFGLEAGEYLEQLEKELEDSGITLDETVYSSGTKKAEPKDYQWMRVRASVSSAVGFEIYIERRNNGPEYVMVSYIQGEEADEQTAAEVFCAAAYIAEPECETDPQSIWNLLVGFGKYESNRFAYELVKNEKGFCVYINGK